MDVNGSQSQDSGKTTILLIDGHEKDRTYYVDRLKNDLPECIVLEAKDGQSGLALYKSRRIDCLIAEFQLPDMSGCELLREVVPPMTSQTVAVVILARTALPANVELARRYGAHAILMKRLTSGDELADAIRKAMARTRLMQTN
jgi:DNA-binding NarL/FixJ family response regulator